VGEMRRFIAQIGGNSGSVDKICNDEAADFSSKMQVHERITGSPGRCGFDIQRTGLLTA